jgi:hypothetical protein
VDGKIRALPYASESLCVRESDATVFLNYAICTGNLSGIQQVRATIYILLTEEILMLEGTH